MPLSLFYVRQRLAAPLAWLMVMAMLSPLSPHLAEGVALCIGEGHVGVEAAGPAHHSSSDERAASPASPDAAGATSQLAPSSGHAPGATLAAAGAQKTPASQDCSDIPLRLVKAGDACYQAVQTADGSDVPSLFASQADGFAHATSSSSASSASDARASRRQWLTSLPPSSPDPSSSTVVLLI